MIPFQHWPEGTPVVVFPEQVLDVTSPEGETRFCYIRLSKKHGPTQHVCVRVVGKADSVKRILGIR